MKLLPGALTTAIGLLVLSCATAPRQAELPWPQTPYPGKSGESSFTWRGNLKIYKDEDGCYAFTIPELWDHAPGPPYWPKAGASPKSIDPSAEYQIRFLNYPPDPPARNYSKLEILEISQRNKMIFDGSICAVHHRKMTRDFQSDSSDWDGAWEQLRLARPLSFPNDGFDYSMHPTSVVAPVWICPSCRSTSQRWHRQRASNPH